MNVDYLCALKVLMKFVFKIIWIDINRVGEIQLKVMHVLHKIEGTVIN